MSFNSLQYPVFLAVVLVLYYRCKRREQNALMVAAGLVFYALFDWRFAALAVVAGTLTFVVARSIEDSNDDRTRRRLVALAVVAQLAILGFFKYVNFFADSLEGLLSIVGLEPSFVTINVLLPVGLSFYTFQTLGYVITVFRREVPAERDPLTYAAFVIWFPQIVAGPIERASTLLPQLRTDRTRPNGDTVGSALLLIATGLFKKVVIADGVAGYVSTVYTEPLKYGWLPMMLATAGFAVQVYGDFSGYSDIARGSSRLLGVELRRNFEQPFLSRDIREFWQRWHTSLNWWFVEFVARPLGGSGDGNRRRAMRTTLVIFGLIGLWHGASSNFVLWGLYNGVLVVLWRRFRPTSPAGRHPMKLRLRDVPAIGFTFALFCGGVVFFRSDGWIEAVKVVVHLLTFYNGVAGPAGGSFVLVAVLLVLVVDLDERRRRIHAIETLRVRAALGGIAQPDEGVAESAIDRVTLLRGLTVALMVVAIAIFSGGEPTPFIYRQF